MKWGGLRDVAPLFYVVRLSSGNDPVPHILPFRTRNYPFAVNPFSLIVRNRKHSERHTGFCPASIHIHYGFLISLEWRDWIHWIAGTMKKFFVTGNSPNNGSFLRNLLSLLKSFFEWFLFRLESTFILISAFLCFNISSWKKGFFRQHWTTIFLRNSRSSASILNGRSMIFSKKQWPTY